MRENRRIGGCIPGNKEDSMTWKSSSIAAAPLLVVLCGIALLASTQTNAQESQAVIADALKAGPPFITEHAAVKDLEGNTLREGTNDWTCYPGPKLQDGKDAMCHDAVWDKWMKAWKTKADFRADRLGFSYMLAGDTGASNIDPYASGPTPDNDWIVEGPHLMIIVPDPALLEGISTDPRSQGPYVMWKGTPYVHIMWPLGPR